MNRCVISLGGSVLLSEQATASLYESIRTLFQEVSKHHQLFIVVGGGAPARSYIKKGRALGLSERELDELGIAATRINAKLLSYYLNANTIIPQSVEEAYPLEEQIIIMGGTTPGHSTDYVGAQLAVRCQADFFIIATNVDGVYDRDPKNYTDAVLQKEISIQTLLRTYGSAWQSAGKNMVIDGPALQLIKEKHIPTYVINGFHLSELKHILTNVSFHGTKITFKKE